MEENNLWGTFNCRKTTAKLHTCIQYKNHIELVPNLHTFLHHSD